MDPVDGIQQVPMQTEDTRSLLLAPFSFLDCLSSSRLGTALHLAWHPAALCMRRQRPLVVAGRPTEVGPLCCQLPRCCCTRAEPGMSLSLLLQVLCVPDAAAVHSAVREKEGVPAEARRLTFSYTAPEVVLPQGTGALSSATWQVGARLRARESKNSHGIVQTPPTAAETRSRESTLTCKSLRSLCRASSSATDEP